MRILPAAVVAIGAVLTLSNPSHSQIGADSVFCGGAEQFGSVPDPQGLYHLYGTRPDLGEFDISSEYFAFDSTFTLYVMEGLDSRWSADSVRVFCSTILNDDPNDSVDIFPRIWAYFCHADQNPSYEGISVQIGSVTLDKISIYLFDTADIDCSQTGYSYACTGDNANCYGYSFVPGYLDLVINASELRRQYGVGCSLRTVDYVARRGFGHEVQHACFNANGFAPHYDNANESLATLSEWIARAVQEKGVDVSYDASIFRGERCDSDRKYYVEQTWMAYLYEAYDGGNTDITDDLVYRWLRKEFSGQNRITMHSLASVLAEPDFAWIGGTTGDERLANLFQCYAVAKFANAPDATVDGRFGYKEYDPQREVAMFADECTSYWGLAQEPAQTPVPPSLDCPTDPLPPLINRGCWNVRILPPDFLLDGAIENDTQLITGSYTLDVPGSPTFDGSVDLIDVALYGTDYVIFRADDYFQDGDEHEFHFDLREISPAPAEGYVAKVWVVGYDTADGALNQQPGHVRIVEPARMVDNNASLVVTNFGSSIKSVVVVVALVESEANDNAYGVTYDDVYYFTYEYEFGVYTPASTNVAWDGTVLVSADVTVWPTKSLTVAPGTNIRIATADASVGGADTNKIEFNVEGSLVANGSETDPIVFASWTPTTTEDWVGFYFDSQSGGGAFNYSTIKHAEYAIESYVALAVRNTNITDCRYAGIALEAGTAFIKDCTLTNPGSFGIFLTSGNATVRNTTVDNAVATALYVQPSATLVARSSQFLNSDKGLYVGGNTTVNVDTSCVFNYNNIGVHCYNTGTGPQILRSTIDYNSTKGVLCDQGSQPLIQENTLRYNLVAIECSNSSHATVHSNMIKSNHFGVRTMTGSDPDVSGGNTFAYTTSKHVINYNIGITTYAEGNCWNNNTPPCEPPANKFLGDVNRDFPICCSVSQSSPLSERLPDPDAKAGVRTGLVAIVPNPFNPSTTIHYGLAGQGPVRIAIYDVAGRFVRELVRGPRPAGRHEALWDGTDGRGTPLASGVYFVRMSAGRDTFTKKMVLLK